MTARAWMWPLKVFINRGGGLPFFLMARAPGKDQHPSVSQAPGEKMWNYTEIHITAEINIIRSSSRRDSSPHLVNASIFFLFGLWEIHKQVYTYSSRYNVCLHTWTQWISINKQWGNELSLLNMKTHGKHGDLQTLQQLQMGCMKTTQRGRKNIIFINYCVKQHVCNLLNLYVVWMID